MPELATAAFYLGVVAYTAASTVFFLELWRRDPEKAPGLFGPRLLLAIFALAFPLAMAGHYTHTFELYTWLVFSPELVWKGQVWRLLTYAFMPMGIVDWLISLFWLTTLVCVLGRNWRGRELWTYCLLVTVVTSVMLTLLQQPAFAIGGITTENLPEVRAAGFNRIAVGSAVMSAEDRAAAAHSLMALLQVNA